MIVGNIGPEIFVGGAGNDTILGYGGDDTLSGQGGNDTLDGGGGDDWLIGDAGDDLLKGSSGNDVLEGRAGTDRLQGGDGDDLLKGGDGNDLLEGGLGFDVLVGGAGRDIFMAGLGIFYIPSGTQAPDTVADFQTGYGQPQSATRDLIDLSRLLPYTGFTGTTAAEAVSQGYLFWTQFGTPGQDGYGTTIYIDRNGNAPDIGADLAVAHLAGIAANEVSAQHFSFSSLSSGNFIV